VKYVSSMSLGSGNVFDRVLETYERAQWLLQTLESRH